MELKQISKEVYLNFALNNKFMSIYQLPEWGELKETTGWKSHLVGLYDADILVGVTLLLEKTTPIKKSLFYAPRGLLIDVDNFKLLEAFVNSIKEYINKHRGFLLKVDPNVIYKLRDKDGNVKEEVGNLAFINMKKLGFKHLGFTLNFETMQPRFLCRFELDDTYEKNFAKFSKSTRKNMEKVEKMGVKVRCVDESEIDLFVSLLQESATNKHFIIRPTSYYKRMYDLMKNYMKLYIAYIDTEEYYRNLRKEIEITEKEIVNLEQQMATINVGNKLKTTFEQQTNKLNKLKIELKDADSLRKSNDKISIGALMSIFINNEGITFMSGTSNIYKNFSPKYAFYNEHIKECIKQNKRYCNFYGISGDMNPNGEFYSIYEIKKGFNPEIVELIGEFDLVINNNYYILYKIALKGYRLLKKVKK